MSLKTVVTTETHRHEADGNQPQDFACYVIKGHKKKERDKATRERENINERKEGHLVMYQGELLVRHLGCIHGLSDRLSETLWYVIILKIACKSGQC